ncbi:hypothetical protein [Chryseobacterium shigense]|uniref:Uncharacterized protein n=1 Tax=Chryseobacterium shigense TaxID=297244 RepID=A0A841N9E8_9FLAO|nr:hypothetical protein [Chryseobacterium shigense]MBB6371321.1 hypothetical protein [Chryseobacterium shigense]
MVRKFSGTEKDILYKGAPLHVKKNGCGGIFLFVIVCLALFFLEMYMLLSGIDQEQKDSVFTDLIIVFLLIVGWTVQPVLLFFFFRNQFVYAKYGEYAVENTFTIERIHITGSKSKHDFIIQLWNDQGNKIEIKTDIRLTADSLDKSMIMAELEKYRIPGFNTINMTLEEIEGVKNRYGTSYIQSWIENFSTPAAFDFTSNVSKYNELLKTEYGLIYSEKTKELLFIDLHKGKKHNFQNGFMINNVEKEIEYMSHEPYEM